MGDFGLDECDSGNVTLEGVQDGHKQAGAAPGRGIYRRGAVFWLNFQRRGVRQFISLETSDYATAIERADELRRRPSRMEAKSFEAEIGAFLAYKRRRNEFTASSAHGRFYILRAFARFVDRGPEEVRARDVAEFYDFHLAKHGAETANSYAMILRSFFGWALGVARIVQRNPCDGLELARTSGSRLRDFCGAEERDRLIDRCQDAELRFVLFCGFHAGLRKNEIIEARPFWFDLGAGLLHLRKTATMNFKDREERTIPLTAQFAEFLAGYGLREPYMLAPGVKHGRNRYRYDFRRPFDLHCRACLLPWVTPHTMRHTFASLLASAGVSLFKISVWLGDDPRVVDRRYARLRPKDPDIERAFAHAASFSPGAAVPGRAGNSPARSRSTQRSRSRTS